MNFKEITTKRASCRAYEDKKVDRELIVEILKETINSPSACNSQPWKFFVCDSEKTNDLALALRMDDRPTNMWATQVPAFIVICESKATLMKSLKCDSQTYAQMDIGIATATMCYSATSKGLSSCIIGVFKEQEIKDLLNISDDLKVRLVISLGYGSKDGVREKARKDFDELVSFN